MSFSLYAEVEHAKYLDSLIKDLDLERLSYLIERFKEWAKDNNFEGSFENFIDSNLDALGY